MKENIIILKNIQEELLKQTNLDFKRDIYHNINSKERLIWLIWERWVWKTTIMLQKIKEKWTWFYFSADNPLVKDIWLFKLVYYLNNELEISEFYIDEIHKYPEWTNEIKSIYDSIPNAKIVFSGSSSLDLYKWVLDLARRANFFKIHTMNYKEYLKYYHNKDIESFEINEILKNHEKISLKYWNTHKEIHFQEFLKKWQYPYIKDIEENWYISKFQNLLDKIIVEDLPVFINLQTTSLDKLRKLLYFIANTTPSELSFTLLSKKVWLDKNIIENVLSLLNKIWIVSLIPKFGNLSDRVRKQYKILLWNTNLYNAYKINNEIGTIRESFFVSQLRKIENSEIFLPNKWDFILQIYDKVFSFEVWWKWKKKDKYPPNTFIIKDDIKVSEDEHTIPLWIFWLLK